MVLSLGCVALVCLSLRPDRPWLDQPCPVSLLCSLHHRAAPATPTPAAAAAANEHAVALNNSDVSSDYVVKLRSELDSYLNSALSR